MNSGRRSMTRDINESIRLVLGKHIKILHKASAKYELKGGDKVENRVLVLSAHRIFVMTTKVPTRIDQHFHYLELRHIESRRRNSMRWTSESTNKSHHFILEDADPLLCTLFNAVRNVFPGVPVEHVLGPILLSPSDRLRDTLEFKPPDPKTLGPCGGFSSQYACMCDYFGLPFREEVAWDVDTIYFSHDSRELRLQDFEHLDHRDLVCILSALEHNTWFTKLRASLSAGTASSSSSNSSTSGTKLAGDIAERILSVVGKSSSLQELYISGIGARYDFAQKLSGAITTNPRSAFMSFDLSCNFLEDKGVAALSQSVSKLPRGLHHVNLSHCSLSSKGITAFASSLANHRFTASTLTYLNLCGNSMKEAEASHALCSFLAQPNAVAILDISSTDTPLDILFNALVRGCTSSLTHLNLSRNPFSSKKAKDVPEAFKQFFATTLSLQYVNLSHCKLPADALKNLLLGLVCNEATNNVELNLSNNNLGANGAAVLENCIGGVRCLSRLDLSENNIEAEMAGVMNGLTRNKSILSLNISRNMTNVKPKYLSAVMESIVHLLQDEDATLTKLNISDCKLKAEINNVINALGSNQCLQHLDIQGNGMGDVGARLLAKALQINTRLKVIHLDRNNISLQGYSDITYALQSNYAMRHIPFPTYDMIPFMKTHPEKVDSILHRLQELLQRNSSPHQFRNAGQAFRLTQGFILSSTQQILDRVSAATQDNVEAFRKTQVANEESDTESEIIVLRARGYLNDAEKSKHLLSALHEVSSARDEIDTKMRRVSEDLSSFVEDYVRKNLENMIMCAEKQCSQVMSNSDLRTSIRATCAKKCVISSDFVSNIISDQVGLEIHNKINELNLIIANNISDRVIDEVIESMNGISKKILSEIGSKKKKRSLTPDVLKQGVNHGMSSGLPSTRPSSSVDGSNDNLSDAPTNSSHGGGGGSITDIASTKSESSPIHTPQTNKRKSLQDRKLRPKSVTDENNILRHTPDILSSNTIQEEDSVPELPSVSALQHLGKARPKRPKKYAPSRGAIVTHHSSTSSVNAFASNDESFNDGFDKFFYSSSVNSVLSNLSPSSSPSGSPMLEDVPRQGGSFSSVGSTSLIKEQYIDESNSSNKSPLPLHKSPTPTHSSKLSCLASSTLDEDYLPTQPKNSPEKKSSGSSPSVHSITDIFARSKKKSSTESPSSPKLDPDSSSLPSKRPKSSLVCEEPIDEFKSAPSSPPPPVPPADYEVGKKTPEEVARRHGVGLGGNMLAEMKAKQEKRSSVIVPPVVSSSSSSSSSKEPSNNEEKNLFGKVKLRTTGLAGSLTSPTSEFVSDMHKSSYDDQDERLKDLKCIPSSSPPVMGGGGSIVGLRASKFSASPPNVTSCALLTSTPTNTNNNLSNDSVAAKPKPLPKPRPWSIVGVDRKSGELTSVTSGNKDSDSLEKNEEGPCTTTGVQQQGRSYSTSIPKKNSVRDLINNMNKVESGSSSSSSTSTSSNQYENVRRKGNSLPRNSAPPTATTSSSSSVGALDSGRSPNIIKKESTSDDPRILKLEDDFAFEDVMDV
ncbi:F-actin-uncapping protein LRRC16A isoform X1 [Lepeophtheirus salmonis]|uniref:F-actin-uncapping protein LRRC16A isoform X1 n=1 Tax=Lepeophtheirus salmonis TaxID=72036 RepID=UPI001AE48EE6|nr:F-actin-uncapping protein LRRC16A-like isoform X1 [Lepeophtheirus salmonis]